MYLTGHDAVTVGLQHQSAVSVLDLTCRCVTTRDPSHTLARQIGLGAVQVVLSRGELQETNVDPRVNALWRAIATHPNVQPGLQPDHWPTPAGATPHRQPATTAEGGQSAE